MTRAPRFSPGLRGLLLSTALVFALLPAAAPLFADDVFQTLGQEVNAIFDKAKASVVQVRSGDGNLMLSGTGFFIDSHGTVLTSSTVIGENTSASVGVNGEFVPARIVGNDPRSGLAELQVANPGSPALPLGQSTDLKTGYTVITVGYPLNLPAAPGQGLISGFDVRYMNQFFATTHIHASIPISPGEVGSPLLNGKGELVGLVVPSPDDGRSIYALPIEAINKIRADFAAYGRARHGWVGVDVIEVEDTNHDGRCVRVVRTVPGTPASQSGILPNDTVMRIDSREIYRPADVMDASFFSHVGSNMTVVVRRHETLFNYSFAVIERPARSAATPASGPKTTGIIPVNATDVSSR
jgi:S1-C subfamily serine protease